MTRSDLISSVREALRRTLSADGLLGPDDVELVDVDADRVVQVRFAAGCASCPSTIVPLSLALERGIRAQVPEVRFVEFVP